MRKVDYDSPDSPARKARQKRYKFFMDRFNTMKRPMRILDIGGTEQYWEMLGFFDDVDLVKEGIELHLLNLREQEVSRPNVFSVIGSALDLSPYEDQSFDLVFSNSVIEHLFTWENQVIMANEVMRVGKNYFVQTPNYWFPIEPHFYMPLIQYLPKALRVWIIYTFHNDYNDKEFTKTKVEEFKLLTIGEMKKLFPSGEAYIEKFKGLNKSVSMYKMDVS